MEQIKYVRKITFLSALTAIAFLYLSNMIFYSFTHHYSFSIPMTLFLFFIGGRPVPDSKCQAWVWHRCVEAKTDL